jgi:hypothetical protein
VQLRYLFIFLRELGRGFGLPDPFFSFFPTFISSCGFGFMRTRAPIRRFVSFSGSGFFTMARKAQKQPPQEFIKEMAEYLGRVIIAASQLEHLIGIILADMLKLTRLQHRSLIIPMSISNKSTLLRQLGKEYLAQADLKTLKDYLEEVRKCADFRNELAHGFYGAKKGKFSLITFSGDAKFSGKPVNWDAKSLHKLAERSIAAQHEAGRIRHLFPTRLRLPKGRQRTAASV